MAYKIGFEGREPTDREWRRAHGLADICTTCRRAFRKPARQRRERTPARVWWDRLKPNKRAEAIKYLFDLYRGEL